MCRICYNPSPLGGMMPLMGSALGYRDKYWPNGSKFTVSILGAGDNIIDFVMRGAQAWSEHANQSFEYISDWRNADMRIELDPRVGSRSYIGTDNRLISSGAPTMNLGWIDSDIQLQDLSTVKHEIGHFLGLGHEHQNPNEPFDWDEDVVIRELSGPPNNWDIDQIRHNVLNQVAIDKVDATTLDRDSIMMYFFPDHWVKSGVGTKQNKEISALDKQFISMIYPLTRKTDVTDEFIAKLFHNERKINCLDVPQLRLVLDELEVNYPQTARRRVLRRILKDYL